jgi:hypothetical protein
VARAGKKIRLPAFAIEDLSGQHRSELEGAFDWVRDATAVVMRGGICSIGLMLELATLHWKRTVSTCSIIDSLARLEGDLVWATALKQPTRYKGTYLERLWHFHFYDARFLAKNIDNEIKAEAGRLPRRLQRIFRDFAGQRFESAAGRIAHEVVMGSYQNRVDRRALTGECIVFDGLELHNYYLTLRLHDEDDADVRARIDRYRECDAAMGRLG